MLERFHLWLLKLLCLLMPHRMGSWLLVDGDTQKHGCYVYVRQCRRCRYLEHRQFPAHAPIAREHY